jgi:hypothetical protein
MKGIWLRRLLWPLTIAVLGYVFYTTPVREVWASILGAAGWTLPVVGASVLLVFFADAFAMGKTFSWFATPISFRESVLVRGASYPLALVNYALGQGAFAFFLHRSRGFPLGRSAATILLVMGINLLLLLLMAATGMALTDSSMIPATLLPQVRLIRILIIAGFTGLVFYGTVIAIRPRFLSRWPVFDVLLSAGISGHLKAMLVRVPHILSLVVFSYIYLLAFGVNVPIKQALLFLPVAFLAAAVPLPGQGVGVAQLIMREIFSPYASGDLVSQQAAVVGASFAGQFIAMIVQMLVGLICLRSQLGSQLRTQPTGISPAEQGDHGQ